MDTSKQFLGNKKTERKTWKITVKNNKAEKVSISILDQIPVSKLSEIEVSIENIAGGISDSKTGELKWNITLEPGAKKEILFSYQVKYPKERDLYIE